MNVKLPKVLAGALLVLALCIFSVTPALAMPVMSPIFSGSVTIGGDDAPIGTTVSAEIEDLEVASVETSVAGHYAIGFDHDDAYLGKTVVFKVNGVVGGEYEGYVSGWDEPSVTLDLAIEGEVVTYYTLTVNISPSGSGTVSLSPTAVGNEYEADTTVELTASAASGYDFDYWSGDASGTSATTSVTMTSDKSVTANFAEEGAAPTPGVGGTAYLPNKLAILAPWIGFLGLILAGGITWLVLRRRRAY